MDVKKTSTIDLVGQRHDSLLEKPIISTPLAPWSYYYDLDDLVAGQRVYVKTDQGFIPILVLREGREWKVYWESFSYSLRHNSAGMLVVYSPDKQKQQLIERILKFKAA